MHSNYSYIITFICDRVTNTTVKWKPLEMADLLRLLQPVASSWETLAGYLLRDDLQYNIGVIQSNCFYNNIGGRALDDTLSKWLQCTPGPKRNWQTLCDAANKYGDNSLEKYMEANSLGSELLLSHHYRYCIV